jgi:hypothetical protein
MAEQFNENETLFKNIKSKSTADRTKSLFNLEVIKFSKWLREQVNGNEFFDGLELISGNFIKNYISSRCKFSNGKFKTSSTPSGVRNALKFLYKEKETKFPYDTNEEVKVYLKGYANLCGYLRQKAK